MHMADALISPAVGGTLWLAATGIGAYSVRKSAFDLDENRIPLMGVMGAFVFAAQMINFSIPGTGSSGHLGGGLLLAIILGPHAGFLTMASILLIQALFFADGGLLALGSNMFNMGFFTCLLAYPLIFKRIVRVGFTGRGIFVGVLLSSIISSQLGSLSVVLETLVSGKTELPFSTFLILMQPIHLAIGLVEGLVTAAIITYVWKIRPDILDRMDQEKPQGMRLKRVLAGFCLFTVLLGGFFSWFASANPDGLEWSILRVYGKGELETNNAIYEKFAKIQSKTAFLPEYSFRTSQQELGIGEISKGEDSWPAVNSGTSISGIVGSGMTLILTALTGIIISLLKKRKRLCQQK